MTSLVYRAHLADRRSFSISVLIIVILLIVSPLPLLRRRHHRFRHLVLPHKHIAPCRAVLALPPTADLPQLVAHGAQRAGVVVAGVRGRLEAEAPLDLQPGVARQVADVPERVGLSLEQRDDNGTAGGKREQGALEEVDEELLVVADLPVDVGGFATDVGEVEYFEAGSDV